MAVSFLVWLAAVASVAGIAWLAIDTAGRQVTAVAAPLPTGFATTTVPAAPAGPTASRTTRGSAPRSAGQVPAAPPPEARRGPRPGRGGSGSPPPTDFSVVTSTYHTSGGRLRVRCEGLDVTLDGGYAQPAPGWTVKVPSGGPRQIEVDFYSRSQAPVKVFASCVRGRPRFDVERPPGYPSGDPPREFDEFSAPSPTPPPSSPSTSPPTLPPASPDPTGAPCATPLTPATGHPAAPAPLPATASPGAAPAGADPAPTDPPTDPPTGSPTGSPTGAPAPSCAPVAAPTPTAPTAPSTGDVGAWTEPSWAHGAPPRDGWAEREWSQRARQPR